MRKLVVLVAAIGCGGGGEGGKVDAPEGPDDRDGGQLIDAPPFLDAFACADDASLEPNDTPGQAFPSLVDEQPQTSFAGLAICPATDVDVFSLAVSNAATAIEVGTAWDGGEAVAVQLLDAAGTAIANGTSAGPTAMRACAANLPAGRYFARASSTAENNYRLTIRVVADCE